MHQDRIDRRDLERAVLRIRLAGVALGATLLVLTPRSDATAAGAVLLGYAAMILIQRFTPARLPTAPVLAVGLDVLYALGLSLLVPLSAGTWAIYAFAIGTAAMEFGAIGAAVATAASILAYDLVIALRAEDLHPSDLWPVQLLLGVGVLVAELIWGVTRGDVGRRRLRTFALAQRDLIAATTEDELLDRLADHAVRSFGAISAWIAVGTGDAETKRHLRGSAVPVEGTPALLVPAWPLDDPPVTRLRCSFFDAQTVESAEPVIRDLARDTAPLLAGVRERSALTHAKATLDRTLEGVRALERDRVTNAVLAELLSLTTAIAGPAALVRPADGSIVAGDLGRRDALALVRDTTPPALIHGRATVRSGAVVSAGPGLLLVAVGATRDLTEDDLHALSVLGEIAAGTTARIAERDEYLERNASLEGQVAELSEQRRVRDDAVASAVHELRTPLTSVHAYAQLTSRNLEAVQQQVKQLDRLIGDLLGSPNESRSGLELEEVDLLHEAKQAARRVALVSGRRVNVAAIGDGPFIVRADRSRIEQVIGNLLGNAVKFSVPDLEVDVVLDRAEPEVVLAVTDHGSGIPGAELQRIFERYYRSATEGSSVGGEGIGLAIARQIVTAHGGRIWAASEGPGKGSTFFVALPIVQPDTVEQPLESTGGRRPGDEAPHQA
ncbi:MAG TPA: ATP-binding protein [Candidatus Limnocylindria bacterium]|nr:ATP-binding protein [Candidatus Limnocylindria bacterium]